MRNRAKLYAILPGVCYKAKGGRELNALGGTLPKETWRLTSKAGMSLPKP